MYLVLGIGNPGKEYEGTRHNIGFLTIDRVLKEIGKENEVFKKKFRGEFVKISYLDNDIIFLKPLTYVNNSGDALEDYTSYFKIPDQNVIVVYDDIDINPGEIRIKTKGSSGGHNGIKSILLKNQRFTRVRVGIGRENFNGDRINHVLSKPKGEDLEKFNKGIKKASDAILDIFKIGVERSMEKYNVRKHNNKEKKNNENKNKDKIKNKGDKMILITGHKNPDTDSYLSAIVAENMFKKLGKNVKAVAQGKPNKETQYVLKYLKLDNLDIISGNVDTEEIILVDHNNPMESVDNLEDIKIIQVIDHHALKLQTSYPLNIRMESLGCTSSILYKMYKENNIEITEEIAKLMLSAIISDSLLFKSPTCTDEDRKIANELEKIAGINKEEYGLEMLKAGTDISEFTANGVINLDRKNMMLKDINASIAQVNTTSIEETLKRQVEFEKEMEKEIEANNLDLFMLVITDIINSNSVALVKGAKKEIVEKAYNVKLENDKAFLSGVVSRKKQIVPILTENA